jgi:Spy/CpxP family protein refolding chaperone
MAALTNAAFAQTGGMPPEPGAAPEDHGWHHGPHHHGHHRHHGWGHRGGWGGGDWGHGGGPGLMGSFRELGLSDAQREQIHTILSAQMKDKPPGERDEMAALANPGDPGYAAAVQAAKTRAAERIQHMSDLQLELYNVLTPQQKTQFASMLAEKKARWDRWAAEHKDHGPPGGGPGWHQGNGPPGGNPPPPPPAQ